MDNKKARIEKEYQMLREELMYNQKYRDSLAQFAYTVVCAIVAAALAADNEWILLGAVIFLLPMTVRVAECSNSTAYIASYMRIYLEPHLDLKWETNHHAYHHKNPRRGWESVIYYLSRLDFPFLTAVCSALFWFMRDFNFFPKESVLLGIGIIVIQFVIVVFESVLICRYANVARRKGLHIERWNALKVADSDKSKG